MVYAGVVNQDLDRSAQTRNDKMSIVIPICRFLGHCWPGKVWCLRTMLSLCEPLALSGHNVLRLSFRQDFSTLRFIARFCDGDIYSPVLSLIRSCRCVTPTREETWLPGLGHTLVRPLCGVPVDDPYSYPPLDRRHRWCMLV
jgi:hypothetical protein